MSIWAAHLQAAGFDPELAQLVSGFVTGEKLLFWLEVLGVCKLIRKADQVLTVAEQWFQVRTFIVIGYVYYVIDKSTGENGV